MKKHLVYSMIGWIRKGPVVKVTEFCYVSLFIGKSYSIEDLCNIIDMYAHHILLDRPWQFDWTSNIE